MILAVFKTSLLALTLITVLTLAKALLHQAGERRPGIIAAFGTALLVGVSTLLTRLLGNLLTATLLTGGLSVLGVLALWKRGPKQRDDSTIPPWPKAAIVLAVLTFALVAFALFEGYWWDEANCHNGLIAVLARGLVPPFHPLFPDDPFRYHYGFDLLAAQVRVFSGANVALAADVAALWCIFILLLVAKDAGVALAGEPQEQRASVGITLAMMLVVFGSGLLQSFLFIDFGSMALRWSAIPSEWSNQMPPPVISNFFQHPQGLGMPLSLASLLLLFGGPASGARSEPKASGAGRPDLLRPGTGGPASGARSEPKASGAMDENRLVRLLLAVILVGILSLAQIVFFGVTGLAIAIALLTRAIRDRQIFRGFKEGVLLAFALGIAFALGGFLEQGSGSNQILVFGQRFFSGSADVVITKHLVHFGIPLLALPFAFIRAAQRPDPLYVGLVFSVLICFIVPNAMTYDRSWDIVKFYGIGCFFLNVLLIDLFVPLFAQSRTHRRNSPRLHRDVFARSAGVLLVFASTAAAYYWVIRMGVMDGKFGVPPMHFPPPSRIGQLVGERLYPITDAKTRILSTRGDVALAAGLLSPGFDWRSDGQSYLLDEGNNDRLRHHRLQAQQHLRSEDLDALDVEFLVFSPSDIRALSAEGRSALADPSRFQHLFDVADRGEQRQVYRIRRHQPDTASR